MAKSVWKKEWEAIVKRNVSKYPLNLSKAFESASAEINAEFGVMLSQKCISNRYYNSLSKGGIILTCGSTSGLSKNAKSIKRKKDGSMPNQNLNPVLSVISLMMGMDDHQQSLIIEIFKK